MKGKRAKGQACFRRNHSTTDQLLTLMIIVKECRNNKFDLFCCFLDFRKAFDTVPRNNPWNRLEELKVPCELRDVMIRLHENIIVKLKNNEGWTTYINCNIGVKQGCPLSTALFGFYIDKLEKCLEKAGCACTILVEIGTGIILGAKFSPWAIFMGFSPKRIGHVAIFEALFCPILMG